MSQRDYFFLKDILLKIPGINSKNIKRLVSKVTDLGDLCQKTEEELTEILENSKNAKQIYEFLNKTNKNANQDEEEVDFEDLSDFYQESKKQKLDTASSETKKPEQAKNKKPHVKIASSKNNQRKNNTKSK